MPNSKTVQMPNDCFNLSASSINRWTLCLSEWHLGTKRINWFFLKIAELVLSIQCIRQYRSGILWLEVTERAKELIFCRSAFWFKFINIFKSGTIYGRKQDGSYLVFEQAIWKKSKPRSIWAYQQTMNFRTYWEFFHLCEQKIEYNEFMSKLNAVLVLW